MSSRLQLLLIVTTILLATPITGCGQERSLKMVPGASARELVPESSNEKEDGITQIIIGRLFKPGDTEYTRVNATELKDAPPFPTGYNLFKDLVFLVKTEAVTSGSQLTVFRIPSAENEMEFKRLAILHLEDDEMSPSGHSWAEVTVFPGGWNEHIHFVSKGQYESAQPDFSSKRIAAISNYLGLFAIALAPESEPVRAEPFPKITLTTSSSPEPVLAGQDVTHTITLKNDGTSAAAEVNVKEVIDIYLEYISATPTQGLCKQKTAANNIVCHLGALPGGATATITILCRTKPSLIVKEIMDARSSLDVVFKQQSTDFVDERGQIQMKQISSTIVKKQ